MQQSNVIFGMLLIAFVIFITLKGNLPIYLTLLRGGGQQGAQGAETSGSGLVSDFSNGDSDNIFSSDEGKQHAERVLTNRGAMSHESAQAIIDLFGEGQ